MGFVGDFLIFAGCVFIVLAIVKVATDILAALRPPKVPVKGDANTIDSVAKLIEAIARMPPFVLIAIVGVFLIAAGQRLLAGLQILPF